MAIKTFKQWVGIIHSINTEVIKSLKYRTGRRRTRVRSGLPYRCWLAGKDSLLHLKNQVIGA